MITMLILLILALILLIVAIVFLPVLIIPAFIGFDVVICVGIFKAIFRHKKRKNIKKK